MLRVEEIVSEESFKSLKQEWMDLLRQSTSNTVFLTFHWLYIWWEIFKENKQLKILLVRDNHELIGIAPFFVHRIKYALVFFLKEVKILGCEGVGSNYLDFIIRPGREEEVLNVIFDYLEENIKNWDCIRLDSISAESKNIKVLRQKGRNNKFFMNIRNFNHCPFINLPNTWSDYINSISRKMSYDIRRKTNKLKQTHDVEFKVLNKKEQLNEAVEDFIYLNQERFKVKEIVGAFRDERFTQFHRRIIPLLFDEGILKLCFLLADHSPISGLYVFQYNKKFLYYQSGLDPQWTKFSPGTVIFSYCIEHAIEEGMEEFDFLQGDENYKNHWTRTCKTTLEISAFKKSLKNIMIFLMEKQRPKLGRIRKRIFNK